MLNAELIKKLRDYIGNSIPEFVRAVKSYVSQRYPGYFWGINSYDNPAQTDAAGEYGIYTNYQNRYLAVGWNDYKVSLHDFKRIFQQRRRRNKCDKMKIMNEVLRIAGEVRPKLKVALVNVAISPKRLYMYNDIESTCFFDYICDFRIERRWWLLQYSVRIETRSNVLVTLQHDYK